MTIPQEAIEAVQKVLQESEALHCTRDWSAWQYGTMTQEDFVPASEEPTLIEDLFNAMRPHIEADLRQKIAAEILSGVFPDGEIISGCPICGDMWESQPSCEHYPVFEVAARIAEGKQP